MTNGMGYGLETVIGQVAREQMLNRLVVEQAAAFRPQGLRISNDMHLRIFDVEHGACAIIGAPDGSRIAMIDSGHNSTTGWTPSAFIRNGLRRTKLDYLFVTNVDQDHISDLDAVCRALEVGTFIRNPSPSVEILRKIKEKGGNLRADAERYLSLHGGYIHPVAVSFNAGMGGVTCSTYSNSFPTFEDTNNLSLVIFIKFGTFRILFAGDLETAGWRELLKQDAFRAELRETNILVASHHGRENGYCAEVFEYMNPNAVVMSDKSISHETQYTAGDYRRHVLENGVYVRSTNKHRHVLTTRRDGDILITVDSNGGYSIDTSKAG